VTPFEQMQRDTERQIATMRRDPTELDDLRSFVRWVLVNSTESHVRAEARSFLPTPSRPIP
jgi:hypothetical protein